MPNGQDRYANRTRKRRSQNGQTIQIGKKLGAVPIEGEYEDVVRYLKGLVDLGMSKDMLLRLGKWTVRLAEAEGFAPASDATPELQETADQVIADRYFPDGKRFDERVIRLEPESPLERWQREAEEWDSKCLQVEEVEAALNLARKYGVRKWISILEFMHNPEETERIKRERYDFWLKHLDVLDATYSQKFLHQPQQERERMRQWYGPQTLEDAERRAELDREVSRASRSKKERRLQGNLVGSVLAESGWSTNGLYAAVREDIQSAGTELAPNE